MMPLYKQKKLLIISLRRCLDRARRYKIDISVIIPVYNEANRINKTLDQLLTHKNNGDEFPEIIVVDGDPKGSTINSITHNAIITLIAPKGRAAQMNRAAQIAKGDILLFLHADTSLPENGLIKIKQTIRPGKYVAGAFNYCTNSLNWFMKHIFYSSYLRSKITHIAYGDQAIFIRKDYFLKLGGYPEIPIMEDIELSKKIKQNKDKICILKDKVKTSTRRYDEEGQIFGWLRNHRIRIGHFLGMNPEKMVQWYPDTRREKEVEKKKKGLFMFLKYPEKGKVKTRLAQSVGDIKAVELYKEFVEELLAKLQKQNYDLHLFFTPTEREKEIKEWLDTDLPLHPQKGDDLGERMNHAFLEMFNLGYDTCVITGSDCPDVPAEVFDEAFDALESNKAVIAPTKDGGYYLLGFQRDNLCEKVFQHISWSTEKVFQQTITILNHEGYTPTTLRQWQDIDTIEDFNDMCLRRATNLKESL
jgi:rSAM/selenodomain-associated transferase 2/rSAM/selenodomain-associated transferase 1